MIKCLVNKKYVIIIKFISSCTGRTFAAVRAMMMVTGAYIYTPVKITRISFLKIPKIYSTITHNQFLYIAIRKATVFTCTSDKYKRNRKKTNKNIKE